MIYRIGVFVVVAVSMGTGVAAADSDAFLQAGDVMSGIASIGGWVNVVLLGVLGWFFKRAADQNDLSLANLGRRIGQKSNEIANLAREIADLREAIARIEGRCSACPGRVPDP